MDLGAGRQEYPFRKLPRPGDSNRPTCREPPDSEHELGFVPPLLGQAFRGEGGASEADGCSSLLVPGSEGLPLELWQAAPCGERIPKGAASREEADGNLPRAESPHG